MILLLKCLVILLQNPQPLFLSKYVQNLNSNSAPPIFPTRSHRVHLHLATVKNLTIWFHRYGTRSHRDGPTNSLLPVAIILVSRKCAIDPTEFAWPTLYLLFAEIGLTEFKQSVSPRWGFALALAHRSHRVDLVGPTKNSNVHIVNYIGLTEFHYKVPPTLVNCV